MCDGTPLGARNWLQVHRGEAAGRMIWAIVSRTGNAALLRVDRTFCARLREGRESDTPSLATWIPVPDRSLSVPGPHREEWLQPVL